MNSKRRIHTPPNIGWRQWGAAAPLVVLCTALSGCAVGSFGTLAANIQRRDTLTVLSVYSLGLHVRTRSDDPGANFGFSKRVYAFPADDELRPGWYFLSVPSPTARAFAQDLLTVGLDLSLAAPEPSVSVGYVFTRIFAEVPLDACVLIEYSGSDLRIDHFQTCAEDTVCALPYPTH
jgi:hypothetical protein